MRYFTIIVFIYFKKENNFVNFLIIGIQIGIIYHLKIRYVQIGNLISIYSRSMCIFNYSIWFLYFSMYVFIERNCTNDTRRKYVMVWNGRRF